MVRYQLMETFLVDGLVETMKSQNVELSSDKYAYYVENILNSIIIGGRYDFITRRNNARDNISKFHNNDYVELIVHRINQYFIKNGNSNISLEKNDVDAVKKYVKFYANYIFPVVVHRRNVELEKVSSVIDKLKMKIYKPSNRCRDAVISGKQTTLSFSSAMLCGMQAFSDVGKIRKNQEDSYYIGVHPKNERFKLMLVADGMGGHNNGEIASNVVAKKMIDFFEKLPAKEFYNRDFQYLRNELNKKLIEIDQEIKEKTNGGGTTLCFSIIKNEEIIVGNIGDSRGLVMEDGNLVYTTRSHNMPALLEIPEPFDRFHSSSNILYKALGDFQGDIYKGDVFDFDIINIDSNKDYNIVLCSDGVSDCLSNDEISDVVNLSLREDIARNLVNRALNSHSKFNEEYNKYKNRVRDGIISVVDWNNLLDILAYNDLNVNTALDIVGGKDNTTAVSGTVSKRGRR